VDGRAVRGRTLKSSFRARRRGTHAPCALFCGLTKPAERGLLRKASFAAHSFGSASTKVASIGLILNQTEPDILLIWALAVYFSQGIMFFHHIKSLKQNWTTFQGVETFICSAISHRSAKVGCFGAKCVLCGSLRSWKLRIHSGKSGTKVLLRTIVSDAAKREQVSM